MSNQSKALCPACGQAGRSVDLSTLKALLAVPLTELRCPQYRFCPTPGCPLVYFSVDGTQSFGEGQLRERVHQKHPAEEDVFVCYCFRHTVGSIRAELGTTQRSTVVQEVTAGIQAGQCACDIRNPQGNCCLGNVRAIVQRLQTEAEPAPEVTQTPPCGADSSARKI